jgi:hypothetical protein
MSKLHSKFQFTAQAEEATPASCPPKKPAAKKAASKKTEAKEES